MILIDFSANSQMQWILILIAIDVLLGLIAALVKKEFQLGKVAGFMKRGILVYVFGFAVLISATKNSPSLSMFGNLAYYLILLALAGSILNNVAKFGIKIPSVLKKD